MVSRAAAFPSIVAAGLLLSCGGNGSRRQTPVPTTTTTTLISGDVPRRHSGPAPGSLRGPLLHNTRGRS